MHPLVISSTYLSPHVYNLITAVLLKTFFKENVYRAYWHISLTYICIFVYNFVCCCFCCCVCVQEFRHQFLFKIRSISKAYSKETLHDCILALVHLSTRTSLKMADRVRYCTIYFSRHTNYFSFWDSSLCPRLRLHSLSKLLFIFGWATKAIKFYLCGSPDQLHCKLLFLWKMSVSLNWQIKLSESESESESHF